MTTRLFLLASILFATLQGILLPVVFAEGLLSLFLVTSRTALRIPLALFTSGIIFDLIQQQTLGVTSLIFLVFGFLIRYLQNHIPLSTPLSLTILTVVINCLRFFILYHQIFSPVFIISAILSYLCFKFISQPSRHQEIRINR